MSAKLLVPLVWALALLSLASAALGAWQAARIIALERSVGALESSLAALEGRVTAVATVASTTASSATSLARDVAAASVAQAAALKSQSLALQDAVAAVTPAVVSIVEYDASGKKLDSGTGFIVRAAGYIVTNKHVVEDTGVNYVVGLASGTQKPGTVVWRSGDQDLALVKIAGAGYPTVALGSSQTLALGATVFAVGNALGKYDNSVSVGIVSGLNRSITATDPSTGVVETLTGVIQTDAAINPGNSGGPLVDLRGHAVGVNVATVRGSQSIGFALPVSEVTAALAGLGI